MTNTSRNLNSAHSDDSLVIEETPINSQNPNNLSWSTTASNRPGKSMSLATKIEPFEFSQVTPKRARIWKLAHASSDFSSDVVASEIENQLSKLGDVTLESSSTQIPFSQAPIETSTPIDVAEDSDSLEHQRIPSTTTFVLPKSAPDQGDKKLLCSEVNGGLSVVLESPETNPGKPVERFIKFEANNILRSSAQKKNPLPALSTTLANFGKEFELNIKAFPLFLDWLKSKELMVNVSAEEEKFANTTANVIALLLNRQLEGQARETVLQKLVEVFKLPVDQVSQKLWLFKVSRPLRLLIFFRLHQFYRKSTRSRSS